MKTKQPAIQFTSYQKIVLALLAILQFTVVLDFMIISPIGDILIKSLDITTKQFGLVVSSYAFSAATSGIIIAGFVDKFDRKKVLVFFFIGFIIGTLFCALSNSYTTLLIARIVTGIFGGVIGSITLTIVSDLFLANQRGRAMGMVQMAFAASQILGIPFGLLIATKFDWHYTFFSIVLLSLIILAVILWKLKPINEHLKVKSDKNPLLHLWHIIKNRNYRVGFFAVIFLGVGGFMLMPFSSIFLVNNVHITNEQLPLIFMITGMSSIIVMPIVGRLSDQFPKYNIFLFGTVVSIIMGLVYTNLPVLPLWTVIVINVLMFVGIMSRMVPSQALNTMMPHQADRGAYMSVSASLQQISGGIGTIVASMIAFQKTPTSRLENFDIIGYVVVALSILCAYLVYRVSVIAKSNVQHHETPQPEEIIAISEA